jgi:ketosteroid isomerase-like protein
MKRFLVSLATLSLLATALAPARTACAQVADSAAAAAAIAESASAFSRALERGDATEMADQYVDDATLIPPGGRLFTGRDAILAFWTPRNPDFRTLEHSLTTDRLVITGDVAMEVGTWRQRGQLREEAPTESSGRYLVVWRRQSDDSWKMQFDSWTAPFPED